MGPVIDSSTVAIHQTLVYSWCPYLLSGPSTWGAGRSDVTPTTWQQTQQCFRGCSYLHTPGPQHPAPQNTFPWAPDWTPGFLCCPLEAMFSRRPVILKGEKKPGIFAPSPFDLCNFHFLSPKSSSPGNPQASPLTSSTLPKAVPLNQASPLFRFMFIPTGVCSAARFFR